MDTGSIDNGVLTCLWHKARFVLSSGKSLDPTIDDIHTYPVTIVEGEVWGSPFLTQGVRPLVCLPEVLDATPQKPPIHPGDF